jgi:hypothetical protein
MHLTGIKIVGQNARRLISELQIVDSEMKGDETSITICAVTQRLVADGRNSLPYRCENLKTGKARLV